MCQISSVEENGQFHVSGFFLILHFSHGLPEESEAEPIAGNNTTVYRGAFQCCYDTNHHK